MGAYGVAKKVISQGMRNELCLNFISFVNHTTTQHTRSSPPKRPDRSPTNAPHIPSILRPVNA